MVTKIFKVYGMEGHRQRESFSPSYKYDFSSPAEGIRIIEVINSDKTGTNEYSIVKITRNTIKECEEEFEGQLVDGIFENSNCGKVVDCGTEIKLTLWDTLYEIKFLKETYSANGNLAVSVLSRENEEELWEPWCYLTKNLSESLEDNVAYLDTNNCSKEIIDWLFDNDFAKIIGRGANGYCTYPLVEFSKNFMENILCIPEESK